MTVTLLASLLSVAAPAAALSTPSVTLGSYEISKTSTYTVRFTIEQQLTGNASSTVTLTFPSTSTITSGNLTAAGITIQASDGWIGGLYSSASFANIQWAGDNTNHKIVGTFVGGDKVGESAQVRIAIPVNVVTNPPDLGDYNLTVATSAETTPVASNSYTIIEPIPQQLPGTVYLYNSSNILIDNWNGAGAIASAVTKATTDGLISPMIKIGKGYYTENITTTIAGITFMPVDGTATADVIIYGTWNINATDSVHPTVIDGLTLQPQNPGETVINVATTGNLTTVKNCVITNKAAGSNLVVVNSTDVTLDSNTINATTKTGAGAAVVDTVITVTVNASATINANAIDVDGTDTAIMVTSGPGGTTTTSVTGNTITGTAASGIAFSDATNFKTVSTVTGNTIDGLKTAILYTKAGAAGSLTAKNNTIKNSTVASTSTATVNAKEAAVDISSGAAETVVFQKNMVMDNNGYSLIFAKNNTATDNASYPTIVGNEFTGNAWGLKNFDTNGAIDSILDVTLNYWGADTGPTIGGVGTGDAITNATGAVTKYKPWSNTSTNTVVTGQAVAAANDVVDASATVGITYTADTPQAGISLASYSGNPTTIDTPSAALDGGFYDVYSPNAVGMITLMFFNTNITQDTKVYYFDSLQQAWQYCDVQGVAANSAYVFAKVGATATSLPQAKDLKGTIFALVNKKTIPDPPAASSLTPAIGSSDVAITPVFTWAPVAGAVRYEVTVADEPSFAIPLISNNSDINFFSVSDDDALAYDTTYYWRVRAVLADSYDAGTPATAYQVGIFTTEMKPADTNDTGTVVNVEPTKPEVKVEIPPTKITVQPAEAAAIPTYILWIIVVVGAVLIIALIVLIVRTRRA